MYCSNCGKPVADDAKFCKYCGHDFSNDELGEEIVEPTKENIDSPNASFSEIQPANSNINENISENNAVTKPALDGENKPTLDELSSEKKQIDNELSGEKKLSRRQRFKKQREIEDARSIENYTVTDSMVEEAPYLDKSRIEIKPIGTLKGLKAKEIAYVVGALVVMILVAVTLAVIRYNKKANDDTMSWLVILGYFLFFVIFFALGFGVDRFYNLMTLNELAVRRITIKKYGWKMQPLVLQDGRVASLDILGECDMCNGENKGTYHIEWQNDTLIAVCNYNRKHIYRIDLSDIVEAKETTDESSNSED